MSELETSDNDTSSWGQLDTPASSKDGSHGGEEKAMGFDTPSPASRDEDREVRSVEPHSTLPKANDEPFYEAWLLRTTNSTLRVEVLPLPQELIKQHAICTSRTIWGQFPNLSWDQYEVLIAHVKTHALFLMSIEVHPDHVNYITRSSTPSERLYRDAHPWTLPVKENEDHDSVSSQSLAQHERPSTAPNINDAQVQAYEADVSKGIRVPEESIAASIVEDDREGAKPIQRNEEHGGFRDQIKALHERIASIASHVGPGLESIKKENPARGSGQHVLFATRQAPVFGVPGDLRQNSPAGPFSRKTYSTSLLANSDISRAAALQNPAGGISDAQHVAGPVGIKSGGLSNQPPERGVFAGGDSVFEGISGNTAVNPGHIPGLGGLRNIPSLNPSSGGGLFGDLRPAATNSPTIGGLFSNVPNAASFPRACSELFSECKIKDTPSANEGHVSEHANQAKTPATAVNGRIHSWLVEPDTPQPASSGFFTNEKQPQTLPLSANYLRVLQEAYLPSTQAGKTAVEQGLPNRKSSIGLGKVNSANPRPFSDPFATTLSPFSNLRPATNNGTGSLFATNQSSRSPAVEPPRSLFDGLGAPSAPLTSRGDAKSAEELDRASERITRGEK
ncbi:hypothetical protein LTS18_007316 [Coniosporium uncinatum]|uniref:Uncharacterized protein n=1 Tax=Coniosporium uncinatum TaxID=93489 RepID=A0ACC3DPD7_9PEZI|nr:hypothetical protein LTS18_007316 [Coniosporium uncinatum]